MKILDRYRRARAWRACFMTPAGEVTPVGEIALTELRNFCAGVKTTMVLDRNGAVDPVGTAMAEGRRQVWLLIQTRLHMSDEAIARLRDIEMQRGEAVNDG